MNKKRIQILGVPVDQGGQRKLWPQILSYLEGNSLKFIITPNPEIILEASKNSSYLSVLKNSDLSLPDGFGLSLAGLLQGKILSRFTGASLLPRLILEAEKRGLKILVLAWKHGLSSKEDIEKLLAKNSFLVLEIEKDQALEKEEIKEYNPDIIINNLGFPWQEEIIYNNKDLFSGAKIGIGVGGAFDFLTGKRTRAPKIFIFLGLEWLYRLFEQKKIKRIWRAVIIFPLVLIKSYVKKK